MNKNSKSKNTTTKTTTITTDPIALMDHATPIDAAALGASLSPHLRALLLMAEYSDIAAALVDCLDEEDTDSIVPKERDELFAALRVAQDLSQKWFEQSLGAALRKSFDLPFAGGACSAEDFAAMIPRGK